MARDYNYSEIAQEQRLSKRRDILPALTKLSSDPSAIARVSSLATAITNRLDMIHVSTPAIDGKKTNPFVLAAHARSSNLRTPFDLDTGLAAAKEFSGLETALGRIVEDIVPQVYGWEQVPSESHSLLSEIDCAKKTGNVVRLAALKSGPACMNDTMVNKIGSAVATNYAAWAEHWEVQEIEYTVGMNYSTGKNSNKKDWHAVRLAEETLRSSGANIIKSCVENSRGGRPAALPGFIAEARNIKVRMDVRQGIKFWGYIADPVQDAYIELCCALAISASPQASLGSVVSTRTIGLREVASVPNGFLAPANAPVTAAQLPWLFLFIRHFVDELVD